MRTIQKKRVITIKIIIKIGNETITIEVEVEMFDMNKNELIDAIASSAKLTKADAGRALDAAIESSIKLRNFKVMEPEP